MIQALEKHIKLMDIELTEKRNMVVYITQASKIAEKQLNESFDKLEKARMDLEKELKKLEKIRRKDNKER